IILSYCFFLTYRPPPGTYPLSLPDALPISVPPVLIPPMLLFWMLETPVEATVIPPMNPPDVVDVTLIVPDPEVAPMVFPEVVPRSEEHTSELQSRGHLVCRLLLDKKKHEIN